MTTVIPRTGEMDPIADRHAANYIPLFWRIFIPNATVLGAAAVVLAEKPANGRVVVLVTGFVTLLAINLIIMRRSFSPLSRLASTMRMVDPLQPGQRVPVLGPDSEVTQVANSFNEMLDRLESERRDSARRELRAQEGERRHIARELHDELGQRLTALALMLDRMATGAVPDERVAAADARDATLESVEMVRTLARRLRPEILDELGLESAVTALCRRVSDQTGFTVESRLAVEDRTLDPEVELVIYRIVQESLTNVVRHAAATRATVTVTTDATTARATITDNGVGIQPGAHESGIRQMRERALLIAGRVEVGPAAGGGTRVEVRVPLAGAFREYR